MAVSSSSSSPRPQLNPGPNPQPLTPLGSPSSRLVLIRGPQQFSHPPLDGLHLHLHILDHRHSHHTRQMAMVSRRRFQVTMVVRSFCKGSESGLGVKCGLRLTLR